MEQVRYFEVRQGRVCEKKIWSHKKTIYKLSEKWEIVCSFIPWEGLENYANQTTLALRKLGYSNIWDKKIVFQIEFVVIGVWIKLNTHPGWFRQAKKLRRKVFGKNLLFNFTNDLMTEIFNYNFGKTLQICAQFTKKSPNIESKKLGSNCW